MSAKREHWGSRLGFIMATAGSAVGLGNIWKFPYMAGDNGGAAFIIIYLALVFTIGLSVLLAEIMIGRASQSDAINAFKKLGPGAFSIVGYMGIAAAFMILSFYCVVAGWTIDYVFKFASGAFTGMDAAALGQAFGGFISDPVKPIIYQAIFVALTVMVVLGGVANGIERAGKILMPILFLILIALVIRSITLPGAEKGLAFFLAPDFSKISGATIMAALGQAFFSLSLGMGAILTYGSYLDREANLGKSAWQVTFLDTSVAILAGLAILPAVFAFGMDPGAGPGLTFVTLPAVFMSMPGGIFFGTLFFLLLTIAALTSSISLLGAACCLFLIQGIHAHADYDYVGLFVLPSGHSLLTGDGYLGRLYHLRQEFLRSDGLPDLEPHSANRRVPDRHLRWLGYYSACPQGSLRRQCTRLSCQCLDLHPALYRASRDPVDSALRSWSAEFRQLICWHEMHSERRAEKPAFCFGPVIQYLRAQWLPLQNVGLAGQYPIQRLRKSVTWPIYEFGRASKGRRSGPEFHACPLTDMSHVT